MNNPLLCVQANLDAVRDYSSTVGGLWLAAKSAALYLRAQHTAASDALAEGLCRAGGDEEATERTVRDIAEVVDEVLDGVRRIAELVAGFTRLAGSEEDRAREPVAISEVVTECLRALPEKARERVQVRFSDEPMIAFLARDDLKAALASVLAYVVSRWQRDTVCPASLVIERIRGRPRISIADPSLRLSELQRQRLFDPRIDVDTGHGRTMRLDLSLSLSCQLLHRNGGEILVAATSDGGTAIHVLLPRSRSTS